MNRLFEPVVFDRTVLPWSHRVPTDDFFKGYYHWHQCCEFLFVHEGRGSIVVNRQAYDIRRGMLFFFQPFQLHHVYAEVSPECPYVRTIFYADPVMIEGLLQAYPARYALFDMMWKGRYEQPAFDLSTQTEVMEWICKSYNEAREKGRGEDPEEIALLLLQLLSCIRAAQGSGSGPAAEAIERRVPRYSETVMRWIEEHYREEISLETLAEETHLSKFYVSRIFREETGSSITDYLTARRIKQACRLLQTTDLSVEQIGIRVGYPNASYFIQLFKKVVGVTPLKYRNKYVV